MKMTDAEVIQQLKRLHGFLQREYPDCVLMPAVPKSGKSPLFKHAKKPYTADMFEPIKCTERYVHENSESHSEENKHEVCMAGAVILLGKSLIVVDVDDGECCTQMEEMFPETFPHTVICKTSKGKHYYFTRTPYAEHIKDSVRKMKDQNGKLLPIDVKTLCSTGTRGVISVPPSRKKEWVRELGVYKPLPIPDEFIDFYNKHMTHPKVKKTEMTEASAATVHPIAHTDTGDYVTKLLQLLSKTRWDDRNNWRDIAIALKNEFKDEYFETWLEMSKISFKYDEEEANKLWDTCVDPNYNGKRVTLGTIEYWAKTDDLHGYLALKACYTLTGEFCNT